MDLERGPLSRTFSGWSNGFIDYNNDGWKDIYSANGDVDNLTANSPQHDTMFENVDGKTLPRRIGGNGHRLSLSWATSADRHSSI